MLDNGDTFQTNPELLAHNNLMSNDAQLRFSYVEDGIFSSKTMVEITAIDASIVFLSETSTLEEINGKIWIGFAIPIPLVLLLLTPLCFSSIRKKASCKRKR